jgi:hypothetical protein
VSCIRSIAAQEILNPERLACLVEGLTLQGWSTMGWVACNRLRFHEVD